MDGWSVGRKNTPPHKLKIKFTFTCEPSYLRLNIKIKNNMSKHSNKQDRMAVWVPCKGYVKRWLLANLYYYYYLTILLLTTYGYLSVLKSLPWLDGWTVGRIFWRLRISKLRFNLLSFRLGCSGKTQTTDKCLTTPARLTLFTI